MHMVNGMTHSFAAVHLDGAIGRVARWLGLVDRLIIISPALAMGCNGFLRVCTGRHLREDTECVQDWPVACAATAMQVDISTTSQH